jgi:ribonuclease HII
LQQLLLDLRKILKLKKPPIQQNGSVDKKFRAKEVHQENLYKRIAGVDEAGRGPLAGPVVAAAVILPPEFNYKEITDSKKLTEKKREPLFEYIKEAAISYAIVAVGPRRIEELNIREATKLAMKLVVEKVHADKALIDGNMKIPVMCEQETIVKGDLLIPLISAASILAKVYRDRLMKILAERYPGYGLEKHAGYPTAFHRAAIAEHGVSRCHRKTFAGVKEFLEPATDNFQIFGQTSSAYLAEQ